MNDPGETQEIERDLDVPQDDEGQEKKHPIEEEEEDKLPGMDTALVVSKPCFIEDGYTIDGFVKAVYSKGDFNVVIQKTILNFKFRFRPCNSRDRKAWAKKMETAGADKENAKFIAARIASWEIFKPGTKEMLPVTAENVHKLDPDLFEHLHGLIMGLPGHKNDAPGDDPGTAENLREEIDQKN